MCDFDSSSGTTNFLSLFVKYLSIDWAKAVRNLRANIRFLSTHEQTLECFELLLNLNLGKVLKPNQYYGMLFDVFKTSKIACAQEMALNYPEFGESELHLIDSQQLYKIRLLEATP